MDAYYRVITDNELNNENINIPTNWILKSESNDEDRYIKGVKMHRFGCSWLNAGGDVDDHDGFIIWMINIPFLNKDTGEIEYISHDDAQDAYDMMNNGKSELEYIAKRFISNWDPKNGEYLTKNDRIIKYYRQGMPVIDISKVLNIPAKEIYKFLRDNKIK